MPFAAILHILIMVACVVHIIRTGRSQIWIYVIVMLPLIGAIAYLVAEILPEMLGTRSARTAMAGAKRMLDPDKAYREAKRALDITPTVRNRATLADICVARGAYDEAIPLYRDCLVGVTSDAPDIMAGLARAQFLKGDAAGAVATLDELKAKNPDFQSADMHLVYARALEALGRDREAADAYAAVAGYFSGEEARCRYALFLRKIGRSGDANRLFEQIVKVREQAPKRYINQQREWIDIARQNLGR